MKTYGKSNPYKVIGNDNGGILSRVSFVLVTLILIGSVLFFLLENQRKVNKYHHRKAIELSDYGLQQIMVQVGEYLGDDPAKIKGIAKTEYDEGWYSVKVKILPADSVLTLAIESKGHSGSQEAVRKENIFLYRSTGEDDSEIWLPKQNR